MKYLSLLLLSITTITFAQDTIHKNDGETITSKILEIGIDEIKYHKYDNVDGPLYIIAKDEVAKIVFENGSTESFETTVSETTEEEEEISLEETKAFILEHINKYGYEEDSFKSPYKAAFEGDYLRLIELKKRNKEEKNKGILYDFSNVYKFQKVSKRSDKLAYVNIWVSICTNEKKNKWDKHKLIMRVDGGVHAESILKALKHYNKLLTEAKKGDSKF